MQSKDIARLAGVSVRTLRHYHQLGILPEPPREANGYRRYSMQHLVRLLRIGRLTTLGLSLAEVPAFLDAGPKQDIGRSLDVLDESLAGQIEVLQQQRATIAALRKGRGPLDMPAGFAVPLLALESGRSALSGAAGREQSVVLGHMLDEQGLRAISQLYHRLAEPKLAAVSLALGRRFDALGPQSDEQEIAQLAKAYVFHFRSWLHDFAAAVRASADGRADTLLLAHALESTTPQQQMLIVEVGHRLNRNRSRP